MYNPGPDIFDSSCIPLHRNENLFVNHDFLFSLMEDAIRKVSISSYPQSDSYELRVAIAKYHNCDFDNVYVGNGADGVLADVFSYLRDHYDEVGLQKYTYQVYPYLCERYNFLQKSLTETDQLWVIDSPNSINGDVFDFQNMKVNPKFLIWDNVYGQFDPMNADFIPSEPNVIRIHSFSKFFALASLRIGYCIGNVEFISKLLARKDIFNVNGLAQKVAISSLEKVDYFETLSSELLLTKEKLARELEEQGCIVHKGKANFVWITHSEANIQLLQQELTKKSIIVRRFEAPGLEDHLRITVPPLAIVGRLNDAMAEIFRKIL